MRDITEVINEASAVLMELQTYLQAAKAAAAKAATEAVLPETIRPAYPYIAEGAEVPARSPGEFAGEVGSVVVGGRV